MLPALDRSTNVASDQNIPEIFEGIRDSASDE